MKLYHGSSSKLEVNSNRCLYLTPDINVARQFALGLDDCGNYNAMSYIYELEIDENLVIEVDDFEYFDNMGYTDYNNIPEIAHNVGSNYYCVKHPNGLCLIDKYKNEI